MHFIKAGMAWCINNGTSVRLGIDPWMGGGNIYQFHLDLIHHLNHRNIMKIVQVADHEHSTIFRQLWRTTHDLDIPVQWQPTWDSYLVALFEAHVTLNQDLDVLVWIPAEHKKYSPKLSYNHLLLDYKPTLTNAWWLHICKLKTPSRACLFMWCVLSNKTPIGEALMCRSIHDPIWCVL